MCIKISDCNTKILQLCYTITTKFSKKKFEISIKHVLYLTLTLII